MDILRILLLLGLILHKLVWEVLKRRSPKSRNKKESQPSLKIRFVKFVKVFILLFLVIQTLFLNVLPFSKEPSVVLIAVGTFIYLTGLVVAVIGRIQLGANWVDLEDYQVIKDQSVVSSGIYRFIRHPIYTGDLLLLTGLQLALNSWLLIGVIAVLLVIIRQASAEEALLAGNLPGYEEYRRQTKMFIPYIY